MAVPRGPGLPGSAALGVLRAPSSAARVRSPTVPLFLAAAGVTALNSVYFKRMMNCYKSDADAVEPHDYAVFVSVFDILLWALFMSGVGRLGGWTASAAKFPRREVLRGAAVDQFGTLLVTVGSATVPGQTQVLLNQAVLPLTMLLGSLCGRRRYSGLEVIGAAVVLSGAAVAAGSPSAETLHNSMGGGIVLFSLAQIAVATANLLKEGLLQKAVTRNGGIKDAADPIALGVTVAWLRVPLGIALALAAHRGRGDFLSEFRDGWLCFLGAEARTGDAGCAAAFRTTCLSVALYAGQTFMGLLLTQHGSATLRSIAAVSAVPLAQLLFTSEAVMFADGAESFSRDSLLGLGLCLLGFALHRSSSKT